ncbi:ABC transporter substrate-binding protein [Escherichia coli]
MKLTDADNAADGIFFPALEQNMMGAVLINENDEVMFFNPAAEKLWGYKREEVIGNNIDMLIPRDLRPAHPEYIRHNREGGKARVEGMSRELQLEKKDGSKIWTRFALSKVSAEGKVYYLALVRDASVEMAQNTAGSGPFMLKSWQKGQQLVLVPNPHYPGNKPNFKRVSVKIIGESASRRLQLSRGDIDIADALPVDQLNALKQENKVNVAEYPSLRVTYLYLNNSKAPLNQADLRRAISWSTDYQGMVNGILSGNGKQMRGPIPEGMWGYDATAMQYNHDETKAKAEWDKVTSKPTSLTFLYSDNDPNWEPIALATQSSLNKLGIIVKLEKLANATMRDRVGKGDYDIAIGNWSPDFADPYMFMNYWFESDKKGLPGNRSFYENSEVDKLLRNALATTDQTQRTRDYQQAQKIVIDDAAYVYLFQKNYQLAMNKEVKGFVFNPMLEQVFNINTMSK